MNDLTFVIGMVGIGLWILFTVYDIAKALYDKSVVANLRRQERAFLKRWYAHMSLTDRKDFSYRSHAGERDGNY